MVNKLYKELVKKYNLSSEADKRAVGEVSSNYKMLSFTNIDGKVILDLGAHKGLFAAFVRSIGVPKKVICVEPSPDNIPALIENINTLPKDFEIIVHKSACVSEITGGGNTTYLYVKNGSETSNTIYETRGRMPVEVKAETISYFLMKYKPDIIKIDIEGAEYEILEEVFNYENKEGCFVFVEYHYGKHKMQLAAINHGVAVTNSWHVARPPVFKDSLWNSTAVYYK